MIKVWVVIVGYCNAEEIDTCLHALSQQSFVDWGVVVCENGGAEAFAHLGDILCPGLPANDDPRLPQVQATHAFKIYEGHPIHLLQAKYNLGYAGAINAAIGCVETYPDWSCIWILNPDTQPHSDALTHLMRKAHIPIYGIIGSRLVYQDTNLVQAYGGIWQKYNARGVSIGRDNAAETFVESADVERNMDYVLGASMLVTRDYIDDIGVMRDDYFLYCEEVDWCLRREMFKLGYAHDSIVYHVQGTTIGSKGGMSKRSRLAAYLDERNRLLIARRFHRNRFAIIVVITALRLTRYLKDAAWQNFFAALRGWWDGLLNRSGTPHTGRFA